MYVIVTTYFGDEIYFVDWVTLKYPIVYSSNFGQFTLSVFDAKQYVASMMFCV